MRHYTNNTLQQPSYSTFFGIMADNIHVTTGIITDAHLCITIQIKCNKVQYILIDINRSVTVRYR